MKFAQHFNTITTPQSQPIPGETQTQVQNNAGGFVYEIDAWQQFRRFLILGSEGGTYYVDEKNLTLENATAALKCVQENPQRAVDLIVEVSDKGLAQKNDAAIFALALCLSAQAPLPARRLASATFNKVIRIGTHLFQFLEASKGLRGWGRTMKQVLSNWYLSREVDALAYQVLKYQNRAGWTHRDVLRKLHLPPPSPAHDALFKYVVGKLSDVTEETPDVPRLIVGRERALRCEPNQAAALVRQYGLTHEMIPNEVKDRPDVWEALLEHMPLHAVLRNLNKMTAVGLLENRSAATLNIVAQLQDAERIRKSRLHPITILTALEQYSKGKGFRGDLTWNPVAKITDALDGAFYLAFSNARPVGGKGVCLALDVSGSMAGGGLGEILSPREITAAMALVVAAIEPNHEIMAFSRGFVPLSISPNMRLDQVIRAVENLPFDSTDCSVPMRWANAKKKAFDLFVVMTDNQTWRGTVHPSQALRQYRQQVNAGARLVVCATTPTKFSIADPKDPGMLDIAGFSSDVPEVIGMFGRGEI